MIKKIFTKNFIKLIVIIIRAYQLFLSPILKNNCRFTPTCSEYSIKAFNEQGILKGFYYSIKRISKCHPFGGYGYDPVPKKIKREN